MTDHDPISQHLNDSMSQWSAGTDDPVMRHAIERSIAAHHALADSPGVTFEAHEDIVIVLHPGFELLDMVGPYHFLAAMIGANVHLATTREDGHPVHSSSGMPIIPTTTLDDAPAAPTVLLIPGGDTGVLVSDEHALSTISRLGQNAELVTSVCSGSLALAAAGLLHGRRATSHWAVRHLLHGYGAIEVDERVVEDGNILTAAGVTAGMDLAIRLVARFRGDTYARFLELGAEYAPEPPFGTGTPDTAGPDLTALSREFLAPLEEQLRAPRDHRPTN
ncbi:MAG: DJ-1/PfpI family protein [Microbacterium sp.]